MEFPTVIRVRCFIGTPMMEAVAGPSVVAMANMNISPSISISPAALGSRSLRQEPVLSFFPNDVDSAQARHHGEGRGREMRLVEAGGACQERRTERNNNAREVVELSRVVLATPWYSVVGYIYMGLVAVADVDSVLDWDP